MRASRKTDLHRLFRHCASGAVAVEFVFIFPLLMGLLVSGNEVARFIRARQQLNDYAAMVAYDVAGVSTNVPVQTLSEMIRRFGLVAPELVDPTKPAWPSRGTPYFSVGVTMVEMQLVASSCPNCKYKAQVRWSFGSNKRSCIELADRGSAAATLTTLPTGAFQPNAVVLVDVSVDYRPIFQNGFNIGGFDLAALNGTLKQTFTAETWQTVRNWRGASPFPGLSGVNAGIWTGTLCP